jgi:hypothetical protein
VGLFILFNSPVTCYLCGVWSWSSCSFHQALDIVNTDLDIKCLKLTWMNLYFNVGYSSWFVGFIPSVNFLQIKAVDNGRPQKSSTTRLHIEWISKPRPSLEPISFEESFFSFTVMESDPVAHMIGVISVEPSGTPLWFDIIGKCCL